MPPTIEYAKQRGGWRRFASWPSVVLAALVLLVAALIPSITIIGISPRDLSEIDINSGQVRYTHFVLGLWPRTSISQTAMSSFLAKARSGTPAPEWHLTSRRTIGGSNEDGVFGAAPSEMREVEQMWNYAPFSDDAKMQIATNIITAWRKDGGCGDERAYIDAIFSRLLDGPGTRTAPVSARDLLPFKPTTQP
jgi:hypothetical protein